MAARLIHRCTRHLCTSFLTVSAPATATVLTTCRWSTAELYRSSAPLAGVRTSSHRHTPDWPPAAEHSYTCQPERMKVDELIESALNTEELLQISSDHKVTGNQAAALLIRTCRQVVEQKLETQDALGDRRFQKLLNIVDSQISAVWNGNLVSLLRSLIVMKLDANNRVLRSVENEIHWRLRRLSLKNLTSLADYYTSYAQTDGQKVLLSDVIKNVELRWTEIADAKTVAILMTKLGHLSGALMDKLEDKGLELAESFTPDDTRRVALALAMQNRRSIPLLRALSYHFMQKHGDLKTGVLIDMAFAYGKLNFQQTQVFQRLAAELLPRVPELSPIDVMRCTKSFAYLKWLNLPLFEALAQYVLEHCDQMTGVQLCNIIMAFARLNYQPTIGEALYAKIHEKLSSALIEMNPFLLVDLVWSLCILQQVNPFYLSQVLDLHFFQRLTEGTQTQKGVNYMLKLIHINTTAQLECSDYSGPYLPTGCLDSWTSVTKKPSPLGSGVREALQTALGGQAKCRYGVETVYGWVIDGEILIDSENRPLAVHEYTASHIPHPEGTRSLPFGAKRLAFVAREFPNYNSRSRDLLGRFAMARRHLQAAGFLIVDVPYYDWLELKSEWQKVAYLKDKMSKAIAEQMAQ
ncbi:FAST kinase domain-containing protein 4 [Scyliorhinus canicula]|uniref:FAST kinase domain-containing protein 4 n=1 Tax=Scyliorhinus canicula TaxID=7830 RepID=UPI0018F6C343|nr:FAST kinase domain-containing protein 4 [Scyliorhinus canicula]XP_038664835.1 FAST kinase domain-containing protein 4 [Scyliorhinus canicula]